MSDPEVQRFIDLLALIPHPEGGFFRETFRSDRVLIFAPGKSRSASTAIYFLLPAGVFSAFHVLHGADEIWHHYGGEAVELHMIAPEGHHRIEILGADVLAGERPQIVLPAGTLQAAIPRGRRYALCGCTVSPGFDYADFEIPTREALLARFPQLQDVISRLTRI